VFGRRPSLSRRQAAALELDDEGGGVAGRLPICMQPKPKAPIALPSIDAAKCRCTPPNPRTKQTASSYQQQPRIASRRSPEARPPSSVVWKLPAALDLRPRAFPAFLCHHDKTLVPPSWQPRRCLDSQQCPLHQFQQARGVNKSAPPALPPLKQPSCSSVCRRGGGRQRVRRAARRGGQRAPGAKKVRLCVVDSCLEV